MVVFYNIYDVEKIIVEHYQIRDRVSGTYDRQVFQVRKK